jgi:hypothetical protein
LSLDQQVSMSENVWTPSWTRAPRLAELAEREPARPLVSAEFDQASAASRSFSCQTPPLDPAPFLKRSHKFVNVEDQLSAIVHNGNLVRVGPLMSNMEEVLGLALLRGDVSLSLQCWAGKRIRSQRMQRPSML